LKTVGIIGGMSWESTIPYYRQINEGVRDRLGGLNSAPMVLVSVNFAPLAEMQSEEAWDRIGEEMASAARCVERAGADFLLLASNTMHRVAEEVETAVSIPFLHIADTTAAAIRKAGFKKVGLLGTAFTMEQAFYRDRLAVKHGIEALIPGSGERAMIHRTIYEELCCGEIREESRARFLKVVDDLAARGAQGIILGCTEIPLLVTPEHTDIPLFDTGKLHTAGAVEIMMEDNDLE
jgi:aspartate racemase